MKFLLSAKQLASLHRCSLPSFMTNRHCKEKIVMPSRQPAWRLVSAATKLSNMEDIEDKHLQATRPFFACC